MTVAQAPSVPSTTDLATLSPAVAITLLVVTGLGITLFYLGPVLKARLTPPPKPPDAPTASGSAPLPAALPAVIDRSASVVDAYIADLKEQNAYLRGQLSDRDRECDTKDREIQRLNDLLQREQWRRG